MIDNMKSMVFDQSTIMSEINNNDIDSKIDVNPIMPNKKSNEKYSLRQRQKRVPNIRGSSIYKEINNDHGKQKQNNNNNKKNNLNGIIEDSEEGIGVKEKNKPKAAPLSKYRRKTANARERTRMREINSAFENLRNCVPNSISGGQESPTNEKLTKITTLRLAMKYIRTLTEALTNPSYDTSFLYETNEDENNFINNNNNNNNNSLMCNNNLNDMNEMDLICRTPTITPDIRIPAATVVTKVPLLKTKILTKSQGRSKQKVKQPKHDISISPATVSSSSSSLLCSMSSRIDDTPTITTANDLGLLLESDGESLHLSEPCLSPLNHNMKPFGCTTSPLELGLFLESDTESLQFSEPCLSPLGTLDSTFNPFGDLLTSTEFSEQTSLDMYLT